MGGGHCWDWWSLRNMPIGSGSGDARDDWSRGLAAERGGGGAGGEAVFLKEVIESPRSQLVCITVVWRKEMPALTAVINCTEVGQGREGPSGRLAGPQS